MLKILIHMPLMAWYIVGGFACSALVIALSCHGIKQKSYSFSETVMIAAAAIVWMILAYALISVPLSTQDRSIHLVIMTIPSGLVKLVWLAFDVFLLNYWISELVEFINTRINADRRQV